MEGKQKGSSMNYIFRRRKSTCFDSLFSHLFKPRGRGTIPQTGFHSILGRQQAGSPEALLSQTGLQKGFDCVGIPLLDSKRLLDNAVFIHQFDDGIRTTHVPDAETRKLVWLVTLGKRCTTENQKTMRTRQNSYWLHKTSKNLQ